MANDISNSDDVIDSRDVIARIEELESDRDSRLSDLNEARAAAELPEIAGAINSEEIEASQLSDIEAVAETACNLWNWDDDFAAELLALRSLQVDAEGYVPDWTYGASLIRRSYFVDYCRELVSDIGDMPKEIPSYIVIDWDATADNLEADYTTVDFDGVEYLVR